MPGRAPKLVSVVIPAYNHGRFIRATVANVLEQTYRPLEVIVVNDGSTDHTEQELEPVLGRIKYVVQANKGLSAARNEGIRQSRGEWIALLDADDLWHPRKLEVQLTAVENQEKIALIGSPGSTEPGARILAEELPPDPPVRPLTVRDLLLSARIGPSSAVIRSRCFESVGMFDESLQPAADRDMWLRIAAKAPCVLVESSCWWYRRHPGQMSRNADRMYLDYRRLLSKFFGANPEYRRLRGLAMSYLYFDAAVAYFDEGRRTTALNCLARSAAYRPAGLGDPRRPGPIRSKLAARIMLDEIRRVAGGDISLRSSA